MSDLIDKTLYNYIESAIIYNLDYDYDNFAILSIDKYSKYCLYYELDNNFFTGYYYVVNDQEFCKIAKLLHKQGLDFNQENTKNLTRYKLDFKIDANKIMTSLYEMSGL